MRKRTCMCQSTKDVEGQMRQRSANSVIRMSNYTEVMDVARCGSHPCSYKENNRSAVAAHIVRGNRGSKQAMPCFIVAAPKNKENLVFKNCLWSLEPWHGCVEMTGIQYSTV